MCNLNWVPYPPKSSRQSPLFRWQLALRNNPAAHLSVITWNIPWVTCIYSCSWSTPEPLRERVCQEDISGKGYIPLNTRENWITTVFYNMPWKYNGQHNQCNRDCMCSVLERLDVIVYCRIYKYDSFPVIHVHFLTVFSMEWCNRFKWNKWSTVNKWVK